MNTSLFIARRYLFSKKSFNAINFISGISVLGVFVGSAALIIILSVFNGFEKVILSMYNTFTPEIIVEPAHGKTYDPSAIYRFNPGKDQRVLAVTEVLQEKALIKYRNRQYIGLMKGVGDAYSKGKQLDSVMIDGTFTLKKGHLLYAVLGQVAESYLGVNVNDDFTNMEIWTPRKGITSTANPAEIFNVLTVHPAGVFSVQQKFDEVVLVPLEFARQLLDEQKAVSAVEITLKDKQDIPAFQQDLVKKLGPGFVVKNRTEQDLALYKTLNVEKISIYIILSFVLVIAIFNIIGSLTMLVIDKKDDILILSSIGASTTLIRNIFFTEGMMISMAGCLGGMLAGFIFNLFQQHYGFITMASANDVVQPYPISMKAIDFLLVFVTVSVISSISSAISSRLSVRHLDSLKTN